MWVLWDVGGCGCDWWLGCCYCGILVVMVLAVVGFVWFLSVSSGVLCVWFCWWRG